MGPHLVKFASLRALAFVVAPLLLAAPASASELAAPALAATVPVERVPLVLGAPPAWVVMALGVAVVSLTVLRRSRKTTVQHHARR